MIISTSEEMNPLRRASMEDVFVVREFQQKETCFTTSTGTGTAASSTCTYLGLYDGHGGRWTVDFLQQALDKNVEIELHADDEASIPERLERAMLMTDIQAQQYGITSSGATVAMCLIQPTSSNQNGNQNGYYHEHDKQDQPHSYTIYTANVGDARTVLSCQGQAHRLSFDHSASDPTEQARIEQQGGFCIKGRVVGVLAVTRSMGNFGLKRYLSAHPYTATAKANSARDFVILACDGLWDVLTDQQAVDMVLNYAGDKHNAASQLTKEALRRGSTDNVTCLVCWL
jgi:serine/threonine protein phosphatase PrpC